MTVTLNLKPEAEARLTARARERGVPVETWLLDIVNTALEPSGSEMTADLQEDDLPIIQPIATRHISARLVYGGVFRFPSIDETDLVNPMTDAMPDFDWYVVGEFDDLQQGDLFPLCPIVLPEPSIFQDLLSERVGPETSPSERFDASRLLVIYANVIVLSQSCVLAKPDCTHQDAANFSKERRAEIAKDRYAALHMIEACEQNDLTFPKQVLDFRTVYGVPKEFLLALAKARGKRVRLLPPYREHLAQAFARYFMRVGLPRNLTPE